MKKLLLLLIIPFLSFGQTPITNDNIHDAVDLWLEDPVLAEETYGHISDWDVSSVTFMGALFVNANFFNEDISGWDVSNVTGMGYMFHDATSFNQNIGNWDVSNVTIMINMFSSATSFNQNIGNWDVSNVTGMNEIFLYSGLSVDNYDALLCGWSQLNLVDNVTFYGGYSTYCNCNDAREYIIDTFNWDIDDGGYNCDGVSIDEASIPKTIIKTVDILGRETTNKGFQLHVYDDGSVEKKYLIK